MLRCKWYFVHEVDSDEWRHRYSQIGTVHWRNCTKNNRRIFLLNGDCAVEVSDSCFSFGLGRSARYIFRVNRAHSNEVRNRSDKGVFPLIGVFRNGHLHRQISNRKIVRRSVANKSINHQSSFQQRQQQQQQFRDDTCFGRILET